MPTVLQSCLGQDQDNRRIGTRPNQGREPPLAWSVEFVKKVHVASNHTAPLVFPIVAEAEARLKNLKEVPEFPVKKRQAEGRGWADMKPTTADNTYTGNGGTKRD